MDATQDGLPASSSSPSDMETIENVLQELGAMRDTDRAMLYALLKQRYPKGVMPPGALTAVFLRWRYNDDTHNVDPMVEALAAVLELELDNRLRNAALILAACYEANDNLAP